MRRRPSPSRAKAKSKPELGSSADDATIVQRASSISKAGMSISSAQEHILFQFRRLDANGDGLVDEKELAHFLRYLDSDTWTSERLGKLMLLLDKSDDGKIQFQEFLDWTLFKSKTTHPEDVFASALESLPSCISDSHSYDFWKVVCPTGVNIRAARNPAAKKIGFKQHGMFVLARQEDDWISLISEPGFMRIELPSAKLLEKQVNGRLISAAEIPEAQARPSRFSFMASEKARGRIEPPSRLKLQELYIQDVVKGKLVSGLPPPKPRSDHVLRVVQWNIDALRGPDAVENKPDPADIAKVLLELHPDVLVFNEAAIRAAEIEAMEVASDDDDHPGRVAKLMRCLREDGYKIWTSHVFFPTVLASKLANTSEIESVSLGEGRSRDDCYERAAVGGILQLPCGSMLRLYATHLNHIDSSDPESEFYGMRRSQAQALLSHAAFREPLAPTLVVGDFNQARCCDYSPEEWEVVTSGLAELKAPTDDGVCAAFSGCGFACAPDMPVASRNWPLGTLPPPTHWTGTMIDYSFAKGLALLGHYVIPVCLSDHLPVVCDWEVGAVEVNQPGLVCESKCTVNSTTCN